MATKAEKKVVIVGKYCVGKTALVTRYTKNRFCEQAPYQAVGIVPGGVLRIFLVSVCDFMIYSPNSA